MAPRPPLNPAQRRRIFGLPPEPETPKVGRQPPPRKAPTTGPRIATMDDEATPLTDLLKRARNGYRRPRIGNAVHVSDLIARCIRKKALIERHGIPLPAQKLSLMDELTFAQGDAIHDVIKSRAAAGDAGRVWGKWRCHCKSLKVEEPCLLSEVDTEVLCDNCGGPANVYDEVTFKDEANNIVGHPDLILYYADLLAYYITELKSISAKQYEDLVRPDPDHVIQVLFYWYLMRLAGYEVVDHVSILYVTKGYTFRGDPYKEFVIHAPSQVQKLDLYLEDARALKVAREGGALPKRACASSTATEARACEACTHCFDETGGAGRKTFRIRDATR